MSLLSIGDLAASLASRAANQRMKTEIRQLTQELTTGRVRDTAAALGGDQGVLAGVEGTLERLRAYGVAGTEAALFTGAMQTALETVQDSGASLGPALLQAGASGHATLIQTAGADARARFDSVVTALNTRVGGRSLFAGTATDGAALASSADMLADLQTATAAATDAAGVIAAVDAWFDTPGGGFETTGYLGSDTALAPFRIGDGKTAEVTLTADDAALRDVLKGYALGALVASGGLSGQNEERATLIREAANRMMAADSALAELRAGIGVTESRIGELRADNEAETSALQIARNELTGIDPYRTATALQDAQTQLETLYAITARTARLSLAEYLR